MGGGPYPQCQRRKTVALGMATDCLHTFQILLAMLARADCPPAATGINVAVAPKLQQAASFAGQSPVGAIGAGLATIVGAWHQNGPAACSARVSFRSGISQTLARSLPTTLVCTPWRLTT